MKRTFNSGLIGVILVAAALVGQAQGVNAQTNEARLQAIEDYIQIEQLLMRYAIAFNTGDADGYVGTFTPDGELELIRQEGEAPFAGPFKGRDELRKQWFPDDAGPDTESAPFRRFGPMRHVTTNPLIVVDGDRATVEAIFIEVVSNGPNIPPGSQPPTIWAMGRYMDELVKVDGQWYFSKRIVITDMNEGFEP